MLTITAGQAGILNVKASGKLTKADYERFVPEFERIAALRGPVRILMELDDFHGWDARGLWEDLKFDIGHRNDFERIAIVGDKAWQAWGTWLSKPLFKAEMRFFDRSEVRQAEAWLSGN